MTKINSYGRRGKARNGKKGKARQAMQEDAREENRNTLQAEQYLRRKREWWQRKEWGIGPIMLLFLFLFFPSFFSSSFLQMSLLLLQSLIQHTYRNCVAPAVLPRMGAALPQLPQLQLSLSASCRPPSRCLGGEARDQIRGGRPEAAGNESPPGRKKDAAALLVK